jgi:predicted O-methyltransferase YrrM
MRVPLLRKNRESSRPQAKTLNLDYGITKTKVNQRFIKLNQKVEEIKVRTWSTIDERALLYLLATHSTVETAVEIGSFCGGSAAFLAGGMQTKNRARSVFSVDPFLDSPVWFPHGWMHSTFNEFMKNIDVLGLSDQIVPIRGESRAAAAVWPARSIDLLFIDGDHSFLGLVSDFENWVPKVSHGGYVLIDDVDHIADVDKFNKLLSSIRGIRPFGMIDGIAGYIKYGDSFELIDSLRNQLDRLNLHRPWDYSGLAAQPSPPGFQRRDWPSHDAGIFYELAYFSVSETGHYGASQQASPEMKSVARLVALDKGDGEFVSLPVPFVCPLRACFCTIHEVKAYVPYFRPGTVILAEGNEPVHLVREIFANFDIEGFDHTKTGRVFWGVFKPASLSGDAIIHSHFRNGGLAHVIARRSAPSGG